MDDLKNILTKLNESGILLLTSEEIQVIKETIELTIDSIGNFGD